MRFDEEKRQARVKEGFDLGNGNDLRIILEFEREFKNYEGKTFAIEGKTIFAFEKFLHDKGIFRFSRKYPDGAVVDPEEYRITWEKRKALDALRYKRFLLDEHNKKQSV